MLKNQSQKGNNGLTKYMYITFSLQAQDLKEATTRLERMEMDILNNFKKMGVKAYVLDGYERLKVIHDILNKDKKFTPETIEKMREKALNRSPMSEETRKKCITHTRPVVLYNLDGTVYGEYSTILDAAGSINCGEKTIRRALNTEKGLLKRQ